MSTKSTINTLQNNKNLSVMHMKYLKLKKCDAKKILINRKLKINGLLSVKLKYEIQYRLNKFIKEID